MRFWQYFIYQNFFWQIANISFIEYLNIAIYLNVLAPNHFVMWHGVGVQLTDCLKLVRITPQTRNFVRNYTHICNFRRYNF